MPTTETLQRAERRIIVDNPQAREFFLTVLTAQLYLEIPPYFDSPRWGKNLFITYLYLFKGFSLEKLGQRRINEKTGNVTSGQSVRIAVLRTLEILWERYYQQSSEVSQETTAEKEMPPFEVPNAAQRAIIEFLIAAKAHQQSVTSLDLVKAGLLDGRHVDEVRSRLDKYGFSFENTTLTSEQRQVILEELKTCQDPDRAKQLLDRLPDKSIRRRGSNPEEKDYFVSIQHLIKQAGLPYLLKEKFDWVLSYLEQNGVPVKGSTWQVRIKNRSPIGRLHVTTVAFSEKAISLLKNLSEKDKEQLL